MSRHLSTTVTKFMWKNKILIPCVLFTASLIMLSKILGHSNNHDGSVAKQPVEFLETIDMPQDRKLGRNQLSWNNDRDNGESNGGAIVFKDIYKDFREKGKDFEGQGYGGVKGEGQVEVVEGFERDAWSARTYDPLSLIQGQGHNQNDVDLETIDDYVIKAHEETPVGDTRIENNIPGQLRGQQGQLPGRVQIVPRRTSWQGSYSVKVQEVNVDVPKKPPVKAYDAYQVELENRKKKKKHEEMKNSEELKTKHRDNAIHESSNEALENNEVLQYSYPPVNKFPRKGLRRRKDPELNLGKGPEWNPIDDTQGGGTLIENKIQLGEKTQSNNADTELMEDTNKVKRMGKKKKRKKKKWKTQDPSDKNIQNMGKQTGPLQTNTSVIYKSPHDPSAQDTHKVQSHWNENHKHFNPDSNGLYFQRPRDTQSNTKNKQNNLKYQSTKFQAQNDLAGVITFDQHGNYHEKKKTDQAVVESNYKVLQFEPMQSDYPDQSMRQVRKPHQGASRARKHPQQNESAQRSSANQNVQPQPGTNKQQQRSKVKGNNDQSYYGSKQRKRTHSKNTTQQQHQQSNNELHQQNQIDPDTQRQQSYNNEVSRQQRPSPTQQRLQGRSNNNNVQLQVRNNDNKHLQQQNINSDRLQSNSPLGGQKGKVEGNRSMTRGAGNTTRLGPVHTHSASKRGQTKRQRAHPRKTQKNKGKRAESGDLNKVQTSETRDTAKNPKPGARPRDVNTGVPRKNSKKGDPEQRNRAKRTRPVLGAKNRSHEKTRQKNTAKARASSQTLLHPSLTSLLNQQSLMLDVQREISEQYAEIQDLRSRLSIADYAARGMVHQPHVTRNNPSDPDQGHRSQNRSLRASTSSRNHTGDLHLLEVKNQGQHAETLRYHGNQQLPHGGSRDNTPEVYFARHQSRDQMQSFDRPNPAFPSQSSDPNKKFGYEVLDQESNRQANTNGGSRSSYVRLGDGLSQQSVDTINTNGGGSRVRFQGDGGGGGQRIVQAVHRDISLLHGKQNAIETVDFKLKHRRKPQKLLSRMRAGGHDNQTRVFSFQTQYNDSFIPSLWNNSNATGTNNDNFTLFPLNFTLDLAGIRQKLQKLSDQTMNAGKFLRHLSGSLYRDVTAHVDMFSQWQKDKNLLCPESHVFEGYEDKFARLHNVLIDKKFSDGRAGGENISDVINQSESSEYYKVFRGFFSVYCASELPRGEFLGNHHINEWFYALEGTQDQNFPAVGGASRFFGGATGTGPELVRNSDFTIAVVRYEYANLYHTMTDFYNAFLMMEFFNKTQKETNILLIDGHPQSNLDSTWGTLFNSSRRIGDLPQRTLHTDLVWSVVGYESPMNDHYMMSLPLVEEFRTFFLSTYGLDSQMRRDLNCDNLSVLFIWRRDYVAHPRNPSGAIQRKVQNEFELITRLRQQMTNHTIRGVQIDLFDMHQQLEFIVNADILIGMHGAGLTHAMFLPKHAGVIELIPSYWSAANMHFEAIATWRNLYFSRWTNENPQNEVPNYSTIIPPEVILTLIKNMARPMCNETLDQRVYHGPGSSYHNNNNAGYPTRASAEDRKGGFKVWSNDE